MRYVTIETVCETVNQMGAMGDVIWSSASAHVEKVKPQHTRIDFISY